MAKRNTSKLRFLITSQQSFEILFVICVCRTEETEEEIQKRLSKWDKYLETEENKKSKLQLEETEIEKTINFQPQDITRQPLTDTLKDEELLEEAENQNVAVTQTDKEATVETSTNI